jgi:3-oxoacyl-[acyl-carrier-protein] synthase II
MRVAITDFGGDYFSVSEQKKVLLTPETSLISHLNSPVYVSDVIQDQVETANHPPQVNPRAGVAYGSSKGVLRQLEEWSLRDEHQLSWPADYLARSIASKKGYAGPVLAPTSACATGAHALILGAQTILSGYADTMYVGAAEHPQVPLVMAAYKNMGALSKSGIMRPFDYARDGFVANSGAGFLMLESEEYALKRGATIHAYLSGYSMLGDATHMTSMEPTGESIARAIEDALRRAGNSRIDYINAHGTATKQNDAIESRGIEMTLGRNIAVSSTKPLTGHLLGAAGAVEAIICLLAMKEGFAPPTGNLQNLDESLNLDFVTGEGRNLEINSCLSLNYGFGGHIGALVFERN